MTTNEQDEQSKSGSGSADSPASGATEETTRDGTKEDIRAADTEQPSPKTPPPDSLRDGTKR
jgi:hypothetical protein